MQQALTVKQFANFAQVSEKTVRKLCASGKLQAVKVGRKWAISRKNLV